MVNEYGYLKGETCNRDGCIGVIDELEKESCSCHINPPCSACTEPRAFCPKCDWNEKEEVEEEYFKSKKQLLSKIGNVALYEFNPKTLNDLDSSKVDYITKSHTHFSMIKEGVYPKGMSKSKLLESIRGTFGGRFTRFGGGKFEYIAYTD